MDFQKDDRIDYLADYRDDMNKLLRYLPWMEEHRSAQVVSTYDGSETQKQSFSFPVYDSTLLSFVREAEKTKLMTKNYPYGYTRNGIRTTEQEIQFIRSARAKNGSYQGRCLAAGSSRWNFCRDSYEIYGITETRCLGLEIQTILIRGEP